MSCTDKNPLTREGASLLNRALAALAPAYAKVDEREAADLLLFAKRYAAKLNFYKEDNTIDGNWQPLMQSDASVTLATLARINVQEITDYKKSIYKQITLAPADADAKMEFKFLFDLLFSLVKQLDDSFERLPADLEYKNILSDVIKNKLQLPLANLEKCFPDYKGQNLLDYTVLQLDNDAPIPVVSAVNFSRAADLGPAWQGAVPDIVITLPALPTAKEIIVYIINHNLFNAQIELLLNGISSVVNRANDLFIQTLGNYPTHSPHFALFIAFIKLFALEQDDLNRYTQRHLDFYYKEVLRLVNRAPEPDSAHLLFELQKPVAEDHLLKDILFKGGKDITGTEITYTLTDDVVINKATVAKIHSLQIIGGTTLKASPIANSDDGQGAKISSADKSWFTFGDVKKISSAQTGFAIASNILYLNEGARTITITAFFTKPVPGLSLYDLHCFSAQFTGKKKWETVSNFAVTCDASFSQLIFTATLTPDDPAIIPYSEKIHQQNMNLGLPVLEIYLDQDAVNAVPYPLLCKNEIGSVSIAVEVTGVKNLVLSNDSGAIDASKPFKPFGDFPDTGSAFYIGNKEIFQKPLSRMDILTSWKSPSGGPVLNGQAHYLKENNFDSNGLAISTGPTMDSISFSGSNGPFTPAAIDFTGNEKITPTTLNGFLRIRLDQHTFSLDQHLKDISAALSSGTSLTYDSSSQSYKIAIAATPVATEVVLNTLTVNYSAETTISFTAADPQDNHLFYHLCPFGSSRVNRTLIDNSADTEKTANITLLQDILNTGELFLGLENASPQIAVSILFQVADGSSNPLRDIETLGWYYLSANNNWKSFKQEDVVDNTANLTQSGVVTLALPAGIDNTNPLLGAGLHWIKLTANPYADAVCKLILIQAQAARVQLVQDDTKKIEFRQVLPANSISKLVVSDSSIKKIQQPFDSFDGRTRETDDHFYIRVSERLRHKQRAITIWDYEHIVLEKFQKIYKVKCISQAGFYPDQGTDVFCENFPGHVSVITIPDQNHNINLDPLRPYTPVGLLNDITKYLTSITSPFVKLHVKNPQFEEIRLDFKVNFNEPNVSFFIKQLNREIERFLCPWAFGNTTEISFGGKIYKSALIQFVEQRPYVNYVTCFKMYQYINHTDPPQELDVAVGSTARSILVSYYDEPTDTRHHIQSTENCDC